MVSGRRLGGRGQAARQANPRSPLAPKQAGAGAIDLSGFSPDDLRVLQRLAEVGMPENQLVAMAQWVVGCGTAGTVGQKIPAFAMPWLQAISG